MGEGLRPFFSYFGSKWRDAVKNYPAPAHETIVEPFAGAAGYSTRWFNRKVRLFDLDPCIVGVWSYLIRVSSRELLALPDLREGERVSDLKLCQEARDLIGFQLVAGVTTPKALLGNWGKRKLERNPRSAGVWGLGARVRLARQVEHIRHWTIEHRSYTDIPENPRATWFVDPPYQVAGKSYRCSSDALDFEHLGRWCRERVGQTIVCENEGAMWLPFWTLAATASGRTGKNGADKRSHEVVWIGRDGKTCG